jgi:hypothetical protein
MHHHGKNGARLIPSVWRRCEAIDHGVIGDDEEFPRLSVAL